MDVSLKRNKYNKIVENEPREKYEIKLKKIGEMNHEAFI